MIAGIDEAGRGPLAGPVVAAAVILDPKFKISGVMDSKKCSEKKRNQLELDIKSHALYWAIGEASPLEIDKLNILQATFLAMRRAIENLSVEPTLALVDGNQDPKLFCETKTMIGGDKKIESISAASILAKVERDRQMKQFSELYPEYQFEKHKGYPTKLHSELLKKFGPCPIHRKSFKPVFNFICNHNLIDY